jgi:hypothetical protein
MLETGLKAEFRSTETERLELGTRGYYQEKAARRDDL